MVTGKQVTFVLALGFHFGYTWVMEEYMNPKQASSKGGSATTRAKVRAARNNGQLGGRPNTKNVLLSKLYDVQKMLVRAVESDERGDKQMLRLVAVDVVGVIDAALAQHGFQRADFWPPDSPVWVPNTNWTRREAK
jgi:hypothetical protein